MNGKHISLLLSVAVIIALVLVTISQMCGIAESRRSKRTDITISSQFRSFFGKDIADAFLQEFGEQHPDLKIQEISLSASASSTPVSSAEAKGRGSLPDIVFFDDSEIGGLIDAEALASLDPYHHEWAARWALPLVSFMDIFVYNIDILKAANRDRPPKTRVEFLAAARAVAESKEEVFAYALGLSPEDTLSIRRELYPWIWANGGDMHAIDSREVMDIVAFMGQLNREKLLMPGTFEKTGAERLEEFAQGKIAMMAVSARDIAFLRDNAKGFDLGVTAMPVITLRKNRLGLLHIYAGISSTCTMPDEAWTFLAFLAGKSHLLAEALGAVPGSFPEAFPGEYITKDSLYAKAWDIFEAADIVEYQFPDEEIYRTLKEKLTEAFK
jgi:multiple sugar transport system substrate-binding protein